MYDKIYPKIRIAMSQEITSNFLILKKNLLYISSGAQHHSALPLWWGAHWFNGRSSVLQLRLTSVRIWPVSLGSYFPTHHVTAPLVFKIFVLLLMGWTQLILRATFFFFFFGFCSFACFLLLRGGEWGAGGGGGCVERGND